MADRFYINSPLGPGELELEGPEAHHLAAVCRLRPGDAICLFNGDGREYPAEILTVQRRHVRVRVSEVASPPRELPFPLEVAAPLPKGDRAQFLVEKLTELGVTRFVPLSTRRSVIQPREAKLEKLQRYVIEASKQCGRNVLMAVTAPIEWEPYCASRPRGMQLVLAHPGGESPLSPAAVPGTCLAVGPEGGFTDEEVRAAREAGWKVVDLGPRILRIETAALVLAALHSERQ